MAFEMTGLGKRSIFLKMVRFLKTDGSETFFETDTYENVTFGDGGFEIGVRF